jgi:V/A-type H+/Na+-transporting ATPase subunit F
MDFFCIADRESGLGFRLAGVETREVVSRDDALEALKTAKASKDIGIILITGKAADLVRGEIETQISDNPMPLILEIPSRGERRNARSAGELLRQIAGM